jgi:DNA topoisomerase-3
LVEGQQLQPDNVTIQAGETTPPKAYTENTLLASMEMAGAEDMPEDAERKGLGTPATRAAMIEKLIATGFVERKQGRKTTTLVPTAVGVSLVTVLPEQLQSPLLTAEWENRLKQVECGELSAETFMAEISRMVYDLMKDYQPVSGAEVLFPSGREVLGKCPRCGGDVTESKKGFFCERNDCRFGLWKDNKFLTGKKISLTAKLAETLLRDGRAPVKNLFSEKTGKSYNAVLTLRDDGTRSTYGLEFPEGPR